MYHITYYLRRGYSFLHNRMFPGRKQLSTLMLYSTSLCDSKCRHCLVWAKRPVIHMPIETIISIMKSKCITQQTVVGLEGGEFLLHPQAFEILQWFNRYHPNFELLSNCLKPELVIKSVELYPPRRLYLSLDGTPETYRYMRGADGHDKVLEVIDACLNKVPISLMFTLTPYNTFEDMRYVVELALSKNIDVRIGIYNNISFFETIDAAHATDIGSKLNQSKLTFSQVQEKQMSQNFDNYKNASQHQTHSSDYYERIPAIVAKTSENYDFLLLYEQWRRGYLKMKCRSILDSLVIHPDGSVPVCQHLDVHLGNVNEKPLDVIFNSKHARQIQKHHVHNCNQCWVNFHRKYDIVLYRTAEKFMPKPLVHFLLGYYQWTDNPRMTYRQFMKLYGKH